MGIPLRDFGGREFNRNYTDPFKAKAAVIGFEPICARIKTSCLYRLAIRLFEDHTVPRVERGTFGEWIQTITVSSMIPCSTVKDTYLDFTKHVPCIYYNDFELQKSTLYYVIDIENSPLSIIWYHPIFDYSTMACEKRYLGKNQCNPT